MTLLSLWANSTAQRLGEQSGASSSLSLNLPLGRETPQPQERPPLCSKRTPGHTVTVRINGSQISISQNIIFDC